MAEDAVGNFQDTFDLLNLGLVEIELLDDIMPFPLILDGIRQAALAPRRHLFDLAPIRLDQLADLFDLLLDRLIVKLRPDDIHELVRRQTLSPFLWDLLRLWPGGGSGAGRRS